MFTKTQKQTFIQTNVKVDAENTVQTLSISNNYRLIENNKKTYTNFFTINLT